MEKRDIDEFMDIFFGTEEDYPKLRSVYAKIMKIKCEKDKNNNKGR